MKRRTADQVGEIRTLLGPNLSIYGRLVGRENVVVLGTVQGNCELAATLVLAGESRWEGTIRALNVLVAGEVEGDIVVDGKLELEPTARITGNLTAPVIAIAEGAVIEGEMQTAEKSKVTKFKEKRKSAIPALAQRLSGFREPES